MKFIIHDKKTNEIVGLFENINDAKHYYLINNVIERLKLLRHNVMNKKNIDHSNINLLRNIEKIMEEIFSKCNDEDNKYNHEFDFLKDRANSILNSSKTDDLDLTLNENIIGFEDDKLRSSYLF